jgi:short-subunit dehydrogenase
MIDLNIRALTDLSLRWTDSLSARRGGILNVASVAGFLPGAGMAVYYASKAYVISFSEALHRELKPKGVRVTALCPGPVPTQFQARAGLGPSPLIRFFALSADRVARQGYAGLMAGKRVVTPGLANKLVVMLPRFLPRGVLLGHADVRKRTTGRGGTAWPQGR